MSDSPKFESDETGSSIRHLALPDVIDRRYRILARLGSGSMGLVLRAEDLFLQRPVAIKVIDSSPDKAVVERFVKEAQSLAQVRHENIVQIYAFGPFQQSYFLAMELVIGQPLEALIDAYDAAGEQMPLDRATKILQAMARGLSAIHAQKLVHRDIKPGNVIIEKGTDRPVLIDFGLARRKSKSSPKLSITGGTPSYMAPEQAKDPDGTRVTARTDIYAFACTMFEVLTGRPVFEGGDIYSVLLAHLSDPPRKISSLRPELAPIDDVISRALAKEPEDRYASVEELMVAFDAGMRRASLVPAAGPKAVIFSSEVGLRRSLLRNATQTLKNHGLDLACVVAESASEAITMIGKGDCALLVVDEESAEGRLKELVDLVRSRPASEVVVVSRDFPATAAALGKSAVRHLVPKPVNVHVFAAVLGRLELVRQR